MKHINEVGVVALSNEELLTVNGGSFSAGQATGQSVGQSVREAIENAVFFMAALCLLSRGRLCR